MMHRRYAIYARQSIDKADSISIETQIERCRFEVGEAPCQIYSDRGYSGKNTDRPQFQQMLEAVKTGEICCVVCYKLDRCSRSILDFAQLMNLLQEYGVAFVSCTEKFDTATPMGRAMLNICIVFAQLERETIQQRITDAYHSRCKKGYFMGGRVPFGFSLVPCLLDGKKTSRYEAVKEEADILRAIYSIYKHPSASLADVVLALNERGISNPRRTDGLWIRPHLSRIIKNPIYVRADERIYDYFATRNAIPDNPKDDYTGFNGCYLYQIGAEQHLVLAPHEGIISSDVWLQCQKCRPKENRQNRNNAPQSWLTGILKCQKCGRAAVIRQVAGRNGRIYRYVLCSAGRGKAPLCGGFKPFSLPVIEEAIRQLIMKRVRDISNGEKIPIDGFKLLREILSTMDSGRELHLEQLKQELRQLSAHISNPKPSQNRRNDRQWESARNKLFQWEQLSIEKKGKIARILIESVKLTDSCVTVVWRV